MHLVYLHNKTWPPHQEVTVNVFNEDRYSFRYNISHINLSWKFYKFYQENMNLPIKIWQSVNQKSISYKDVYQSRFHRFYTKNSEDDGSKYGNVFKNDPCFFASQVLNSHRDVFQNYFHSLTTAKTHRIFHDPKNGLIW